MSTKRARDKLARNAAEIIADYGVDLSQATVEVHEDEDGITADVNFKQPNGLQIVLSNIFWQKSNGKILQYGTNYGDLTL